MRIINTISEMRTWIKEQRENDQTIGLVPTMGYLHEGHLSLVRRAAQENDQVVMSIFVNSLQFGPKEDYATYPRDLEKDAILGEQAGVDVIFHPEQQEIYPQYPPQTVVNVSGVTEGLCGADRPGHFAGVATIVTKLFNITQPDRAYFGQKDYQQVQVIKHMAIDLNLPIRIVSLPIIREADGLAMSSRNTYLSIDERREALALYQALLLCRKMYEQGEKQVANLRKVMEKRILEGPSAVIDYIEIRDAASLESVEKIEKPVVVALAVKIGQTRLIDNMVINGI